MNALKTFLLSILTRFLLRGTRIYWVCGMSRSGNHACINWLANALEGRETGYRKVEGHPYVYIFGSGGTMLLNNVPIRSTRHYLRTLWKYRGRLRTCRNLIVSAENVGPGYRDWRIPRWDEKIQVRRSVCNLVASRLKALRKKAQQGLSDAQMVISEEMFRKLAAWKDDGDARVWTYDRWLTSEAYRADFLDSLGLQDDIMPRMGSVGASSFGNGKQPDQERARNRYEQVDFPGRVVRLLEDHRSLLEESEWEYLSRTYASEMGEA